VWLSAGGTNTTKHPPARLRATLILRNVLSWLAAEVAELLGASIAAVNSALHRARATLAEHDVNTSFVRRVDGEQRALLARCIEACERFDGDARLRAQRRRPHAYRFVHHRRGRVDQVRFFTRLRHGRLCCD
jgi:hypothetical protein